MSAESSPTVVSALLKARAGSASIAELAEAFRSQAALVTAAAPGDLARYFEAMDEVVAEKGVGNVMWGDVKAARPIGTTNPAGEFVPYVFTSSTLPREFAVGSGAVEPHENVLQEEGSPGSTLLRCLQERIGGIIIDPGTEHEHALTRDQVARLAALLTRDGFAALSELWLLVRGSEPIVQKIKGGGGMEAIVYTSAEMAAAACDHFRDRAPDIAHRRGPAAAILRDVVRRAVDRLLVDPMTPAARWYDRDDLNAMLGHRDGGERKAAESRGEDATAREPAAAGPVAEERGVPDVGVATAARSAPPAVEPALDEVASYERFQQLRGVAERQEGDIWDFQEALAFEMGFHAAVYSERVDGLLWPQSHDYSEQQKVRVHAFVLERVAKEVFGENLSPERPFHRLSGLDLLRWAYASPAGVNEIMVDNYVGTQGQLFFPPHWVVDIVCPLAQPVEALSEVRPVGIAAAGALPGARALKPEVARALVTGWRQLLVFKPESDGALPVVQHDGGSYVPVFSRTHHALDFDTAHPGLGIPTAVTEPPFAGWIVDSRHCDGMILDPGSPHPLVLDHGELLGLHLWAEQPESALDPARLVTEVGLMHRAREITDGMAGRMLAEWPRYFGCMSGGGDSQLQIMTVPGRDCCALFTSAERAAATIRAYSDHQSVEGMRPVPLRYAWRRSFFHELPSSFEEGAWIDPDPADSATRLAMRELVGEGGMHLLEQTEPARGVHVTNDMARAVAAAVDEKLVPRVPGFAEGVPA